MRRSNGFTLIELVIVMIIISVGLVGLTSLFSNTSKSLTTNEVLQQAAQYAQECAERAIATRRSNGFTQFKANGSFSCGSNPSGFTRLPNDTNPDTGSTSTGTSSTACPNGIICRNITITVTSGTLSSSITLMLADY